MAIQLAALDAARDEILLLNEQVEGSRTLLFYWDVGRIVLDHAGGYGSNTREELGKQLAKAGIDGLQKENLAKAAKFARTFDRRTVSSLQKSGVGWRAAAMLCSSHIENRRDELVDAVISRKVAPDDLGGYVRKMSGQAALTNTRSIATASARATEDIKLLIRIAFGRRTDDVLAGTAKEALQKLRGLLDKRLA